MLLLLGALGLACSPESAFSQEKAAAQAYAGKTVTGEVTVKQTVEDTLQSHRGLKVMQENLDVVRHELRRAKAGWGPSVDAVGRTGASRLSNTTTRPLNADKDMYGANSISLTLTQPLWDGFATRSRVRTGEATVDSMTYRVLDNATSFALDAIIAHVDLLRRREILQLAKDNVRQHVEILDFDRLDEADEVLLRRRFDALRPLLSPQVLDAEHPLPFLRNREQYVLVRFAGKRGGAGLVPTTQLPKFFKLTVDGVQKLALTAPLVAHFAPLLFGERRVRETAIVRVTRSADISVRDIMDGCDADLRAVMERLLRRRRRLEPVRAQVQGRISDEMRALARELLGLPKRQLFVTSAPTDLSFVLTMPGEFDLAGLTCPEIPPAKNVALQKGDYFAYLAQHDLLLALPYQSINPFVDLLYEAADDPDVVSIKITLYRLAGSSRIAAALAYAAEHGKQVQCLLELRARFDEQSNIDYSRMLEDAGCGILYGLTKYKVHTKLCLITRRCPGGICYYTQVGTGNYNEKTAEQYTDLMLLTSDPAIGRDAAKTFDRLARGETVGETEALWLAPEGYKPQLMAHIEAQTRLGPAGYIGIKVNSMNDADVMARLVRASEAGTEVELFVRGICCLLPGVPGHTENITVTSIVGRFLEHSRIYVFGRGVEEKMHISSADLMTRNTERRVEIACPIDDPAVRTRLHDILYAMQHDTVKARVLQPDGTYCKKPAVQDPICAQDLLMQQAIENARKQAAQPAPHPGFLEKIRKWFSGS